MMKWLISILTVCSFLQLKGQATVAPLQDLWLVTQTNREFRSHPGIQPAIRQSDTTKTHGYDLLKETKANNYFKINGVPDSYFSYDDPPLYRAAAGVSLETQLNNKFYARTALTAGYGTVQQAFQSRTFLATDPLKKEAVFADVRARASYTFNKAFQLSGGLDNQFFGEGTRSLVQGDQTTPSPFVMLRASVWRFEYGLLYQAFREHRPQSDIWKFSTTHYLSFNATRNWNITLLENVLFRVKDSIYKRGFELEYLNPIVFFRPQEYSLGSSDNVLLAAQTSLTIGNHTAYGQVALDEFDINEIRAKSKWWANKFAVQLGVKGLAAKHLRYRIEGNIVRPYTYSHINDGQNIGNLGSPLAHPSGGNFAELLAEAQVLKNKWNFKSYGVFLLKGYDSGVVSYGGDVYKSYTLREKEYGHVIGQGVTLRTVTLGTEISYLIPALNSRVYVDPQVRTEWGDLPSATTFFITTGIRSELFGVRKRF